MTRYHTQSHYPDTEPTRHCPILTMQRACLGSDSTRVGILQAPKAGLFTHTSLPHTCLDAHIHPHLYTHTYIPASPPTPTLIYRYIDTHPFTSIHAPTHPYTYSPIHHYTVTRTAPPHAHLHSHSYIKTHSNTPIHSYTHTPTSIHTATHLTSTLTPIH